MTTFEAVAKVIAHRAGVPCESLTPDTRLLHDLGIYGDDVDEILFDLDKLGVIDWSDFRFDNYFYSEPHLFSWGGLLHSGTRMKRSSKLPLTIAMLVAAVERGRWSSSVPRGRVRGEH